MGPSTLSGFGGEVDNVSSNQRLGWSSCFSNWPKNTHLVVHDKFLLPVKFGLIPFSSFRGDGENGSSNQRPVQSSCSSNGSEKPKKKKTWSKTLKSYFMCSFIEFRSAVS